MNILNYNSNTIQIPIYDDGYFYLYKISQKGKFPIDHIKKVSNDKFYFNYQSIGYKMKYELADRNIEVDTKIVLQECNFLSSEYAIKIKDKFYTILNAFHSNNKKGFPETILTLGKYKKYIIDGE